MLFLLDGVFLALEPRIALNLPSSCFSVLSAGVVSGSASAFSGSWLECEVEAGWFGRAVGWQGELEEEIP